MEHQNINLLDDTTNQRSKFRTRNWVEINDELNGRYNKSNIRFKTYLIRSNLCEYSDAYVLAQGTIKVPNTTAAGAAVNNSNKKVMFKSCASFNNCISKINNAHVDDAQKSWYSNAYV